MRRCVGAGVLALLVVSCGETDEPTVVSGLVGLEDGVIAYDRFGSGETVVLIHGGFVDRRMWDAQFDPLTERFHIVRYDLRGFGESSTPAAPHAPEADLIALLDAVGAERAHLVGLSMGSLVALRVAQAHPGRVASLVLAATGDPQFDYPEEDVQRIASLFDVGRSEGADAAVERWLAHPMLEATMRDAGTAASMRRLAFENRRIFELPFGLFAPVEGAPPDPPVPAGIPVLVIAAGADTPTNRAAARALAERIPQARYEEIAGAGHMVNMEEPETFTRLLLDFLPR